MLDKGIARPGIENRCARQAWRIKPAKANRFKARPAPARLAYCPAAPSGSGAFGSIVGIGVNVIG